MADELSHANPLLEVAQVHDWLQAVPQPVAITGGTGFVGSHLVDTLCAAGIEPRVLVRSPQAPRWIGGRPVQWVPGSLDDKDSLERLVEGSGTVIHVAAVVRAGRAGEFDRTNRGGTAALVEAVQRRAPQARLVHVSSLAALGPSSTPAGSKADDPPRPASAYGRSKLAAEHEVSRVPGAWVVLRPPAVYGPRDTDVLQFFQMAARRLMVAPSGERWITTAFVADVVRAIVAAAAVGVAGRSYHIGEPQPRSMDDLMSQLAAAGGVEARIVHVPPALVTLAGIGGSLLHLLGLRRIAMTRDKAADIVARHWSSRTADDLEDLGIRRWTAFDQGAAVTWRWYRSMGWLP